MSILNFSTIIGNALNFHETIIFNKNKSIQVEKIFNILQIALNRPISYTMYTNFYDRTSGVRICRISWLRSILSPKTI